MSRILALVCLYFAIVASVRAQTHTVVINEIMYAPTAPEPEWVELFNYDSARPADLAGWTLESGTTAVLPALRLAPLELAVLAKDTTSLRSKRPGDYRILQCALPNLRNSGDTVLLRDSTGVIVDLVGYLSAWGGSTGKSLERIDGLGISSDRSNWLTSRDSTGATPGRANSVVPLEHDLMISTTVTQLGDLVTLKNLGRRAIVNPKVVQINFVDTVVSSFDTILNSGDSLRFYFLQKRTYYGRMSGVVFCDDSLDEDRSNDTAAVGFMRQIPRDSLVINEIMSEPSVNSCEWIELYNNCTLPISLRNTYLRVGERLPRTLAIDTEIMVRPNTYAIIAADSLVYNPYPSLPGQSGIVILRKSSLNLTNDSATVVLASYDTSVVDSVHYLSKWHTTRNPVHTGLSLERRSPNNAANDASNWQTSSDVLGATPLAQNSGKAPDDTTEGISASMTFSPNPFSPDGDGFEDQSTLTITSDNDLDYALRARIFDGRASQVRVLAEGMPFRSSVTLTFDGKNDRGQTLAPGLYAAQIELSSQNPPRLITRTIGVVIAGKRR